MVQLTISGTVKQVHKGACCS